MKWGWREEDLWKWIEGKWRKWLGPEECPRWLEGSRAELKPEGVWKLEELVGGKESQDMEWASESGQRVRDVGSETGQTGPAAAASAVYGIKVKGGCGQCDRRRQETAATEIRGKIFGVPFNSLPHSVVPEYGHIPSFLVDACTSLKEHIHTEGLFRKSGSVIRLKALKSKLDHGEACLSSALPCDVAGLLKQFFRELPEPVLPADLHEALFKLSS